MRQAKYMLFIKKERNKRKFFTNVYLNKIRTLITVFRLKSGLVKKNVRKPAQCTENKSLH